MKEKLCNIFEAGNSKMNIRKFFLKSFLFLFLQSFLVMAGYAQKEMVSLDVKDVKLETVFQSIQEQTGYKIFYNNELVNATQLVTIQVTNVPLDTALRKLLTPLNLTYKTVDKTIVISKEAPVKTGVKTVELFEITGTVRDQQGEILPGVTVVYKETPTQGTSADAEGKYRIRVPSGILVYRNGNPDYCYQRTSCY